MSPKTVFILGAGASKPYGYPTGKELRKDICTIYRSIHSEASLLINEELRNKPPSNDSDFYHYIQFADTFKKSSTQSIDLFLSLSPKHKDSGKLAIVKSIWAAERNSKFREEMPEKHQMQDWYSYFYDKISNAITNKEDYSAIRLNEFAFVTFNYDRSLEHFLWESFSNSFSEIPQNQLLNSFPLDVWHVYGQIHYFEWQNRGKWHHYQKEIFDASKYYEMSENIRVIHEDQRCSADALRIYQKKIIEAENIIFLGFGFAKENMEVLGLPKILEDNFKNRRIFSTAYGLTRKESSDISSLLIKSTYKGTPLFPENYVKFGEPDWDCLRALREWNILG